jgi:hypothetical protein
MCITLSYTFWKVFVMACRHSIFAFKDYFQVFCLVTRKKRMVTGSGWVETLHQGALAGTSSSIFVYTLWIMHEHDYPMMPNLQ